jgi:hypothetical protein
MITLFSIIALGFSLGMRHATDPVLRSSDLNPATSLI